MTTRHEDVRPVWQRALNGSWRHAPVWLCDMVREPRHWKRLDWADQFVFICGCGHSGTTLALRILGAHPDTHAIDYETGAFEKWKSQWTKLRRLRFSVQASGKRKVVEKSPRHIRHLGLIRQTVPGAKFVVPVRDGRDVAASIGRRFGGNFQLGVDRWISDCRIIARERNADDLMWYRYEDMVAGPATVTASICSFLNIPFDDVMLCYYQQRVPWQNRVGRAADDSSDGEGHLEKRAWQANQPIFDGRGLWKTELPPEIAKAFMRGEAGALMEQFGYL
jgi:hypothetical protein